MDLDINSFPAPAAGPKKRLLFIITQSEMGGAQQFLLRLLCHLQPDQYDIRVAIGRDGDGSLIELLRPLGVICPVLRSLRRDINFFSDLKAVFETKKLITNFDPETIFLLSSKAGFVGSLAARLSQTPAKVIYRIGGWTFNDPWPNWKKKLWIRLEKISAPWKDIIIVNNALDHAQAAEYGIAPREEIKLIHNGIDPYKLEFLPKDEARQKLLKSTLAEDWGKKKIIGTIANFYPTKGLPQLIEAAGLLNDPDALVVIIGDGSEREDLEEQIATRGLTKKVILAGHHSHAAQYLSAFDIFVLPSLKEGFPWAVLEAMSAKLPIVATRVGAIPEIIEDGVQGYIVSPHNPEELATRLSSLLQNERLIQEMGIKAHQKVLFSFTQDAMIAETVAVL